MLIKSINQIDVQSCMFHKTNEFLKNLEEKKRLKIILVSFFSIFACIKCTQRNFSRNPTENISARLTKWCQIFHNLYNLTLRYTRLRKSHTCSKGMLWYCYIKRVSLCIFFGIASYTLCNWMKRVT